LDKETGIQVDEFRIEFFAREEDVQIEILGQRAEEMSIQSRFKADKTVIKTRHKVNSSTRGLEE